MKFESIKDSFFYILSIFLRFFPLPTKEGLFRFGNPTADSPVFVTGNWLYTVLRLKKELKNKDAYLLVADSAGSNVWCAAGVGDFNEHKIADAVNAYGLKDIVNHRTLIISQLAAVGVNREILFKECGFKVKWGPANYYDLDKFFSNGLEVNEKMRLVHWHFRDRLYIAIGKLTAYYIFFIYYSVYAFFFGSQYNKYAVFIAVMLFIHIGVSAFEIKAPFKWPPTYVVFTGVLLLIGEIIFAYLIYPQAKDYILPYLLCSIIVTLLIAADSAATDKYKTTLGHWLSTFNTMSLFQPRITDKCIKCGDCIEVCPKGLISRAEDHKVVIDLKRICCECLACVKQCPNEAIANINKGFYKKDIKVIPNIEKIMN